MDIERGNLEILFKKIPYDQITMKCLDKRQRHDYKQVNRRLYLQYARDIFIHSSEDERNNHYLFLEQCMHKNSVYEPSVFQLIMDITDKMLTYDGDEVKCRFEELLRWREISFQLGQDFFTCAFLAKQDLEYGHTTTYFAWLPIILSDNERLHHILDKGIAENHFHLGGSTKIFELNWLCLMNLIDGRLHDFKQIEKAMQSHYVDRISDHGKKESFYAQCQRAALYRVYLFVILKKDQYLTDKAQELKEKLDKGTPIEVLTVRIQDIITMAKNLFGARVDGINILDYALEKDMIASNNNECRLLAGERRFLYECYKAVLTNQFTPEYKNLFYQYLSLRTNFRGELIQVNRQVGFANFSDYQDRKEQFIKGEKAYETELVQLAVNESIRKKNVISLEARICPKNRPVDLHQAVAEYEKIAKQVKEKQAIEKLGFVLHFPKSADKAFCQRKPRNYEVRERTAKQMKSIAAILSSTSHIKKYIRGIDACSSEIGCRPETFAQFFRYLLDIHYNVEAADTTYTGTRLHATYHAGEDFLDIVDGIRAIDETLLFCGLERGSRIGHGLALGIDPQKYYQYKGYKLVLPKQILLDDIAWMLNKGKENGCSVDGRLRTELEERFYGLYQEVYSSNVMDTAEVSILEYYQSWRLRGDNPEVYRLSDDKFLMRLSKIPLNRFERYELNDKVSDEIRRVKKLRRLYCAYHYDKSVRDKGSEMAELKVDDKYAELVYQLQDSMIRELVRRGIAVETNPSSNYLIGTIEKYDDHPILRFNKRKLGSMQNNMSLCVSINTDDQGVFDTSLENEYALMALALKKTKDENNTPLYDIEDIYEWIEYIREMGVQQIFKI